MSRENRLKRVMATLRCNRSYGNRSKGGTRDDLGIYVRSSWEANIARYLNFLVSKKEIASWQYEPDTFEFEKIKRGTRFYTPDFKVFNNDGSFCYWEVKGYMDEKSATKLKRMRIYHPEVKVQLIDREGYKAIARWARLIPGWEG